MPKKGSKRRKTRTHVKPAAPGTAAAGAPAAPPKSIVIHTATIGPSASQLTLDLRKVLEPNTGTRIKERKSNRLRDFVAMSGVLGVSHLLVLGQTGDKELVSAPVASTSTLSGKSKEQEEEAARIKEATTTLNLRLIRLPRGPTLSYKVLRYSLAKDVARMAKRPRAIGREFMEAPLLILSGFGAESAGKEVGLMAKVWQNLFPSIHVQSMPLTSLRRIVLLSYNPKTRTTEFRHYLISIRPLGVSKPIRKIITGSTSTSLPLTRKRLHSSLSDASDSEFEADDAPSTSNIGKGVLDLSRANDISDYILSHHSLGFQSDASSGASSASEAGSSAGSGSEADEKKGRVRLGGNYLGRGNKGESVVGEKRAVKLVELGPRMELGLVKVEEGVGEGGVLFHELIHKTTAEAKKLSAEADARRKLRAERKKEQEERVKAKKLAKGIDVDGEDGEAEGQDGEDEDDEDDEDEDKIDSDIEYDYEKEHGLPVPEDSEDEFASEEEYDEDEEFSEGGSDGEEEEDEEEPEFDDDDSDLEPIPLNSFSPLPETASYPKPSSAINKSKSSATGFSHKGFVKQERKEPMRAVGIAKERGMTKKDKKREEERERKAGKGKKKDEGSRGERYEDRHGGLEESGGGRGGRGGRGDGRGGFSGRGDRGRGAKGRGRGK